jgi:hypothetical protein
MHKNLWILPAVASASFCLFSLWVVGVEGPFGFMVEHMRNGWGLQIGLDLVLSALTAFGFLVHHGRRHGVRPLPWLVLVVATGSIGLLALVARVLYADARMAQPDS